MVETRCETRPVLFCCFTDKLSVKIRPPLSVSYLFVNENPLVGGVWVYRVGIHRV